MPAALRRWGTIAMLAALGLACALGSHWLITHAEGRGLEAVQWLFLAQHAGAHAALALWFGSTLRAGRRPLIGVLARRVHGHLTPAMAVYTRQVTQAWVLYFALIALASVALFLGGQVRAWSLLVNAVTPVATLAMFAGEYLLRYWLHPEFERVGFLEAMRAWRAHSAEDAGPGTVT